MRALALIAVLFCAALAQAQYVDRVIASVNGTPILWSDVEEEVRVEALLEGTPLADITLQQRNEALNRLIDTTLLDRQIREAHATVDTEVVSKRLQDLGASLRAQRNAASNDAAWQKLLQEYGLTQSDLDEHLRRQVVVLDFVDLRFRAGVQITPQQIDEYYKNEFTADMRRRGAPVPALATVKPQIERILLERGVGEAMEEWLRAVRGQADIWRAEPFGSMNHEEKRRD